MSSIHDPELTDEEYDVMCEVLVPFAEDLSRRFGWPRTRVILKSWHISEIAGDLAGGVAERRRTLGDLNEGFRHEQLVDHMTAGKDEATFRPWLLIPTREP